MVRFAALSYDPQRTGPTPPPPVGLPLDAVRLFPLNKTDDDYRVIQNLFESSWNHPDKAAQIQGIYMVRPADGETGLRASGHCYPSYMGERFNEFMRHLDEQSRYRGVPVEPEIRFHGTYRACLMGEAPPGPYGFLWTCRNHECRLCKIMGNSLCLPADGAGMFGSAIYSSTCSSKADHYARNHHVKSQIHVLLVCAVVTSDAVTLFQHDYSFHELKGEIFGVAEAATTTQGGEVKYPETITYTEKGIIPIGLVAYTRQGWTASN